MSNGHELDGTSRADGSQSATAFQLLHHLYAELEDILTYYSEAAVNKLLADTELIQHCKKLAWELTSSDLVESLDISRGMAGAAWSPRQKQLARKKATSPTNKRSSKNEKRKGK